MSSSTPTQTEANGQLGMFEDIAEAPEGWTPSHYVPHFTERQRRCEVAELQEFVGRDRANRIMRGECRDFE